MNCFLPLLPDLSAMSHVLRTPLDQYQALIVPVAAWLRPRGVRFVTGAFVRDTDFAATSGRITVDRLDCEHHGEASCVTIAPDDIVLVTLGSHGTDLLVGSMTKAPSSPQGGQDWALWQRLAQGRTDFGNPGAFFGATHVPDTQWVTFMVSAAPCESSTSARIGIATV